MDRIALAAIASGLVLILATIATVVTGQSADGLPMLAAIGAILSGGIIVCGLVVLERRATSPLPAA
ncbi:hypothetical protein [Roseomonas xinghualingensis]|uniref:hypothetical protein n=1 Tax=Roseomonas xinghualingensis TaxID=2986475 RepID=UPI0021F0EA88|nr:hypothetical protein [Roseomonas sp. SXEYE001]MCV4208126.1 hypothetical protein [Roseomonas sp. SXEYE001]